jgi:electron transport complex protein RnfC
MPIPSEVVLPVSQHIGAPASVVVEKGDEIKKGQVIAEAGGFVSVPVHASISGKVKAIEPRYTPLGMKVNSVVIESDGEDVWADGLNTSRDISSMSSDDMRKSISAAGIVGLGGAAFPTHVKLSPPDNKPIDIVMLNGVECEPYATCDNRLMLESPGDIIEGFKIIMNILNCKKGFIGIELNKPEAIKVMREAVKDVDGISVAGLRVKYPQGGEKQLIYALTKRKVPAGGLPMDVGCVVQNVGTAAAIYEAVALNNAKLINGGPMMGISQFTDEVPVIKGTSCLLVMEDFPDNRLDAGTEQPCISCARCIEVCPMNLVPTEIARFVEYERFNEAKAQGILDCFECGACTYICPAKRRLLERIKFGKAMLAELRAEEEAKKKAEEEKSGEAKPV